MNQKIKGIIEGRKLAGEYHQNLVSFKKAKRILNSANHTTLVAEFESELQAIGFESIADTGVPFWVNCKAAANEEPVNDVTISLAVTGVAAAV